MAKKQSKGFKEYTAWASMSADLVLKNLTFVGFVAFLLTIYIANAHYAEKQVLEIQRLQKEVKELRWRYMSIKSEMMYNTKQSQVAKAVEDDGLKIRSRRPKKVVVE
ncbi:MAG: FtsL-like putative cell division protein [Bacteroidota bacterium]